VGSAPHESSTHYVTVVYRTVVLLKTSGGSKRT
jgi:hypothetical protein